MASFQPTDRERERETEALEQVRDVTLMLMIIWARRQTSIAPATFRLLAEHLEGIERTATERLRELDMANLGFQAGDPNTLLRRH